MTQKQICLKYHLHRVGLSLHGPESCGSSVFDGSADLGATMAGNYLRKMGGGSRGRRGTWDCEIFDSAGTLPLWPPEFSLHSSLHLPGWQLGALPRCPPLLQPPLGLTQLLHLLLVATLLLREPQNTLRGPTWEGPLSQLWEPREAGSWVGGKLGGRALLEQLTRPARQSLHVGLEACLWSC